MDSNETIDMAPDWRRTSILESYGELYKDPHKAKLLSETEDPFDGSTCPEVEDRYINVLDFVNNSDVDRDYTHISPLISEKTISVVGDPGSDFYTLPLEDQEKFLFRTTNGETKIAMPVLEIESDQLILRPDSEPIEGTVLVKNPYNRIKGETFPLVEVEYGAVKSPLVTGVQNGLILVGDDLVVVEGAKNGQNGRFEWKPKRFAFDNQKYEHLDILKDVIEQKNFKALTTNDIHEKG
ncbi:hypothetical protein KBD68_02075 [Candidatus Woesebacteria bacterium]|nr:hypothetical protein [Candidatus Woesebacteria bacterium]